MIYECVWVCLCVCSVCMCVCVYLCVRGKDNKAKFGTHLWKRKYTFVCATFYEHKNERMFCLPLLDFEKKSRKSAFELNIFKKKYLCKIFSLTLLLMGSTSLLFPPKP